MKLPIQASLIEAGNHKTTIPEDPHMQFMNLVLFCPKHNFNVVKQQNKVHHVKLGIFLPHLHIKFIKF